MLNCLFRLPSTFLVLSLGLDLCLFSSRILVLISSLRLHLPPSTSALTSTSSSPFRFIPPPSSFSLDPGLNLFLSSSQTLYPKKSPLVKTTLSPETVYNASMARPKARKGTRRVPRFGPWTPEEEQIVDRYARQFARGKTRNVYVAARRAHAALVKMPRDRSRHGTSRPRTLIATYSKMLDRVKVFCPDRAKPNPNWTAAELEILHGCARELKAKGLPNTASTIRKCWELLRGLGSKAGGPRSIRAVAQKLRPIARSYDIPPRRDRWSPEEFSIAKAWARRFLTVKTDVLPWRIHEMATLMQVELEAKGFKKRSPDACRGMLREMLGRGRRGPAELRNLPGRTPKARS
jgi:hypothetical protein